MCEYSISYLKNLSKQFPNIAAAATEIINLQSILTLPKGTEHFLSDIHGEYEQFEHVLRNGSGTVRRKIEDEFGDNLTSEDKRELATLIYYPERKLSKLSADGKTNMDEWYMVTINRLVRVCKSAASKYTRSKVRKSLPKDFAYVIEELMNGRPEMMNQEDYYKEIIRTVIRIGKAPELIIAICNLIRRFTVDHIHVVGDIFDRGPGPQIVMDTLMKHHSVDIQWGNHDVLWMGAAAGQKACVATVLRISAKYGNLNILEDGYGINMIPLMRFAYNNYRDDLSESFKLTVQEDAYDFRDATPDRTMHKAIAIIQFKLEGQLIKEHPEFHMEDRLLLDKIDIEKKTVTVDGVEYPLTDSNFPTIDWSDPYKLSEEEEALINRLTNGFVNCERLQRQIRFMYSKGNLYKVYNGNLIYHGCVPLNEDGSFKEVEIYGEKVKGKALFDTVETWLRKGFFSTNPEEKKKGMDLHWWTWINGDSPLFGKTKMTTFERYFVADKATHKEPKNPYYTLYETNETVSAVLKEFGVENPDARIVNGHIPVETTKGDTPVKCNGRLLVIDGGFSKAYQPKTGIAGYTLTYNSYGFVLVAHEPFTSVEEAVNKGTDIHSDTILVQQVSKRQKVADTDTGRELQDNIDELEALLKAYRDGKIVEKV